MLDARSISIITTGIPAALARETTASDSAAKLHAAKIGFAQAGRKKKWRLGPLCPRQRGSWPSRGAGDIFLNRLENGIHNFAISTLATAPMVTSTNDPLTFKKLIPTRQ